MITINIFISESLKEKVVVKRVSSEPTTTNEPPNAPYKGARRFSATENHILEVVATMPDVAAIGREKFIVLCAESLPAPEPGERDNRMVRASAAIADLCKGKDAPLREIDGVIHFLIM